MRQQCCGSEPAQCADYSSSSYRASVHWHSDRVRPAATHGGPVDKAVLFAIRGRERLLTEEEADVERDCRFSRVLGERSIRDAPPASGISRAAKSRRYGASRESLSLSPTLPEINKFSSSLFFITANSPGSPGTICKVNFERAGQRDRRNINSVSIGTSQLPKCRRIFQLSAGGEILRDTLLLETERSYPIKN